MRIVSCCPAATEWVGAFGAGEALVGRSHACLHPASLPVVTSSAADGRTRPNVDLLHALAPDLVLASSLPGAGNVPAAELDEVIAGWTHRPEVFAMEPATVKQALDAALRLGLRLGRMPEAMAALGAGERRLRTLHDRLGLGRRTGPGMLPSVACFDALPLARTAGRWLPGLVEHAGGRTVDGTWRDVVAADPDVICLVPPGRSPADPWPHVDTAATPGWSELKAVRAGRVYRFEGDIGFARPGPRLYRAVELLAATLYPDRLGDLAATIEPWERQALAA